METPSGDLNELLSDFAEEAICALRTLQPLLESYHQHPADSEPINAVFRAVHSVKGNAGFFGLTAIKTFAHTIKSTLDRIRNKELALTAELTRQLISAFDQLDEMVGAAAGGLIETEQPPRCKELLAAIGALATIAPDVQPEGPPWRLLLQALEAIDVPGLPTPSEWLAEVSRSHLPELDACHADLLSQDDSRAVRQAEGERPTPAALSDATWMSTSIDLADRIAAILDLFLAFDRGQYESQVGDAFMARCQELAAWSRQEGRQGLAEALDAAAENLQTIVNSPVDLDPSLLSLIWDNLWPELVKLIPSADTGQTSAPNAAVPSGAGPQAPEAGAAPRGGDASTGRLVRVKEERLDEFLNRVARLFITGEMLKDLQSRMAETGQLRPLVEELRQITRSFSEQANALQKGLFALRRVSVAGLFSKFPRMARSVAEQLGKQIDVKLVGSDVELDKALIEDLDAPLTHILRNAVDHGIDAPQDRAARGASELGEIVLAAEVTRTHARITVSDNGRGIDPQKLRAKAVDKGFYTAADVALMSDEEAIQLIFHPGFSTAEKLSDVSGRGVGLDVVRTSVRKHNGEVFVTSQLGVGTTFRLEVPLREAVIVVDGLTIRQCGQDFVVPFEHIREITQLQPKDLGAVQGSPVITIRGSIYDARPLSSIRDLPSPRPTGDRPLTAVLVGTPHSHFCLLVDEVKGNRKVVVNSIGNLLPQSNKIAGVAQLGGGRLALVLSIPDIVKSLALAKRAYCN